MYPPVSDPELGQIIFSINPRSRRIFLRITPDGIKITLPSQQFYEEGIRFLEQSRVALLKKKKRCQQWIDQEHPLQTLTFVTKVVATNRNQLFFRLSEGILTIEYPVQKELLSNTLQAAIRKGAVYFMRQAAKRELPTLLKQLAEKNKFNYSGVKIQSSQTRWGSCSRINSINLSLYLMLLPRHLIEYVLLHELCHTVEHNHSERFWRLLKQVAPDSDALKKELSKHAIRNIF
jgi:predicted metal-dependent hydrolase